VRHINADGAFADGVYNSRGRLWARVNAVAPQRRYSQYPYKHFAEMILSVVIFSLGLICCPQAAAFTSPVVDLGYARYQGVENKTLA